MMCKGKLDEKKFLGGDSMRPTSWGTACYSMYVWCIISFSKMLEQEMPKSAQLP